MQNQEKIGENTTHPMKQRMTKGSLTWASNNEKKKRSRLSTEGLSHLGGHILSKHSVRERARNEAPCRSWKSKRVR